MGIQSVKSFFKLYDMSELSPEVQFKNKSPQYFWAGSSSNSPSTSRRTTPAQSRATSRRNSVEDKKNVSACHAAMKSAYGI